ncbi:hypothetical protein NN561_007513 [Cricetulus griseus]
MYPRAEMVGAGEEGNSAQSILTGKHPSFCGGGGWGEDCSETRGSSHQPQPGNRQLSAGKAHSGCPQGKPRMLLLLRRPPLEKPCPPSSYKL